MGCRNSKAEVITPSTKVNQASQDGENAADDGFAMKFSEDARRKSMIEIKDLETKYGAPLGDNYLMGPWISSGVFLEVRRCVNKINGKKRAVKVIRKNQLDAVELQKFKGEIQNLKTTSNHQENILNVYGMTEDDSRFYVVTEARKVDERLELQESILASGRFSERNAALLIRQLFDAIGFCHSNNLVHGYLRPENILLERNKDVSNIRIINFNPSLNFDNNRQLNEKFQTPHLMAPEIFDGNVDDKSDAWSAGAMIYLLLSGSAPFTGSTDQEIIENIQKGEIGWECPVWQSISESGKDLITKLMTRDLDERICVEDALSHDWIANAENIEETEATEHEIEAQKHLKDYNNEQKLIQALYSFIAKECYLRLVVQQVYSKEQKQTSKDHRCSFDEICELQKEFNGQTMQDDELQKMYKSVNPSGDGPVDMVDFFYSQESQRQIFTDKQLQDSFTILEQDAATSVDKILKALRFSVNLTGQHKNVVDEIVQKINELKDSEEACSQEKFMEIVKAIVNQY